jgi:hypothetical protein
LDFVVCSLLFLASTVIVSIPVWISTNNILEAKQAKFTRAMLVTAVGPIMYGIIFFISTRLLSSVLSVGNNNYYYSMSSVNMTGIAIAFLGIQKASY